MLRRLTLVFVALFAAVAMAPELQGQAGVPQWSPPTREMPAMPLMADLQGDWLSPIAAWFGGVEQLSGVSTARLRAAGEARSGSDRAQFVRFTSGPVPVAAWSDRNGDGRLDMLELYRNGVMVIQVIDADYDGRANVMRVHDASGTLVREERLNR
ncbi:hypothetical protein BH24GEM3_BH24GEM3_16640 [soil metagenome]